MLFGYMVVSIFDDFFRLHLGLPCVILRLLYFPVKIIRKPRYKNIDPVILSVVLLNLL